MQRDVLATMVSAVEHTIQQRRQQLDGAKRADFDLARSLSESRFQLEQLVRQREEVENAPAEPVVIESYPTPISRAVDGPEAHLLISNGRVVFVPIEPLLEEFQSQAKRQVYKLRDQPELTETVGPVGGFRLRYTLERHDVSPETCQTDRPRRQLRAAGTMDAHPHLERSGRAGAIGLARGLRLPSGVGEDSAGPNHHHHLGLSRRLRGLPSNSQGAVPAGLHDRRSASAARHIDQRLAGRQQVGRTIATENFRSRVAISCRRLGGTP